MKKEKEEIVLSEFERKEIFRNRVYKVLPVIAIILLILLWVQHRQIQCQNFRRREQCGKDILSFWTDQLKILAY